SYLGLVSAGGSQLITELTFPSWPVAILSIGGVIGLISYLMSIPIKRLEAPVLKRYGVDMAQFQKGKAPAE
ncbi:MAG: hypothetical protein AAGF15_11640, partial [Pseudomonadota bacterium]